MTKKSKGIKIENRILGDNKKCFLIAEIGSNHNRSKATVRKLIDAAAKAKFDAVKFQIYDAEEAFSKNVTTSDVNLESMYGKGPWWKIARDKILMPRAWFEEMFDYARKMNLIPFSAVHRPEDIKFLLDLGAPLFKIASIDCNHLPLLKEVARLKKPMLISTGMAYINEIDETVKVLESLGNSKIVLLHCISCYPPKPLIMNLRNISMLRERYGYHVGFSDHSPMNVFSVAAVALGACVIEKHITLNRKMKGPDHPFALEPQGMIELVQSIRETEKALGSQERILSRDEIAARRMIRRSIVAKVDIKKGTPIKKGMVKFSRPGTGITPNLFEKIEGRRANKDIKAETVISWRMLG
ncbi:MAG: N-acetylneuraminate synthase family protein [Candidatus Omnitrophica bacterium]|nr:N-acetylneuraminate synthase family protein [Candidatus Omnitrophota bacterium]